MGDRGGSDGGVAGSARAEKLAGAHLSAIGTFSHGVISYFDWETKEFRDIPVDEQVEVA